MAVASLNAINISSNWKIINDKPLKNAVTVVDTSSSINFDDLVTLDSCIALSQQDLPDLLEVFINSANPNFVIKDVCIVSEARLLELFGKFGEYDNTTNATNTDDGDEEMQVYRAKLSLKTPSPQCTVKFAGIAKDKKEMWLLGLGIVLQQSSPFEEMDSIASRVGKILQESQVPLSENAENCKKLVLAQQQVLRPNSTLENDIKQYVDKTCFDFESRLKEHIDLKFKGLEDMINKRLDDVLNKIS